jgi:hypothetical protein
MLFCTLEASRAGGHWLRRKRSGPVGESSTVEQRTLTPLFKVRVVVLNCCTAKGGHLLPGLLLRFPAQHGVTGAKGAAEANRGEF